jgi:hypothetical protein
MAFKMKSPLPFNGSVTKGKLTSNSDKVQSSVEKKLTDMGKAQGSNMLSRHNKASKRFKTIPAVDPNTGKKNLVGVKRLLDHTDIMLNISGPKRL